MFIWLWSSIWIHVLVTLNWRFVCFHLKLKKNHFCCLTRNYRRIFGWCNFMTTEVDERGIAFLFSWQISHIGQLSILRILPNYYIPPSSTKDGNVMCLCVYLCMCLYVCVLCVRVFVCACNNFNRLLCVSRCSSKVSEFGFDQCVCVCV